MIINVSEILVNASVKRDYLVTPEFDSLNLKRASYPVSQKEEFVLAVELLDGKLHISCDTSVSILVPCDRCLDDVELTFPIIVDHIFDPKTESDDTTDAQEYSFMDGCMLDVDKLVSDEIVVALPTKVLCKEDCKGLCSVCGTNLNHGSCNCDRRVLDPRMAAIQDIFNHAGN